MANKRKKLKFPLGIEFLCDNALAVIDKDGYPIFEVTVEDYSIPREIVDDIQEILDICNKAKAKKKA